MSNKVIKLIALIIVVMLAGACFAGCDIDNDIRNSATEFLIKGESFKPGDISKAADDTYTVTMDDAIEDDDEIDVGGDAIDPVTGEKIEDNDTGDNNDNTGENKEDNSGDNTGENKEDNSGDNTGDNGSQSGENNEQGNNYSQDLSDYADFGPVVQF